MVVLLPDRNDAYRSLGERIAEDRDEELTYDVDALDFADPIRYVGSPHGLQESTIYTIQERSIERLQAAPDFAVITGRTLEEARELYLRGEVTGEDHALLLRRQVKDAPENLDSTSILSGDEATPQGFSEAVSDGLSSLTLATGARKIHAYLRDGLICGFPSEAENWEFPGRQPPCVSDGEMECTRPGDVVMGDRIRADQLFLNGCGEMLPEQPIAQQPIHLGQSLLANVRSFIGGLRVIHISPFQPALHYCLTRAGYTADERTYLLNRATEAAKVESYPYALFGDPDGAVSDPLSIDYHLERTVGDEEVTLELTDVRTPVVDVKIDADAFGPESDQYLVRLQEESEFDERLFYNAFLEGDQLRVLLYSWGQIEASELEVVVSTERFSTGRRADRVLENAEGLEHLGLFPSNASGQLDYARNNYKGIGHYREVANIEAGAYLKIRHRLEEVNNAVETIRDELVDDLLEFSSKRFLYNYGKKVYSDDVRPIHDCPYCGDNMWLKQVQDVYDLTNRGIGMCANCAYVFDAPVGDREIQFPTLIDDITELDHGETVRFDVEFANPFDRDITAVFAPNVIRQDRSNPAITPERVELSIEANEVGTAEFEIDSEKLDPYKHDGQCFVHTFVVTDELDVYVGIRNIQVYDT